MTLTITTLLLLATTPGAQSYEWRNVEIGAGGFVTGIVAHPRAKDLRYCRTDIGGAYRWNASTKRWEPLLDWLTRPDWNLYGVESLAVDPSDANRLYLAVGTYTNEWGGNGAILRSRDRGKTFLRTDLPFKNGGNEAGRSIGERLAVDPCDGRILYFGTRHNGLMRSTDFGAAWHKVESFPAGEAANGVGIGWVLFDPRGSSKAAPCRTIYAAVCARAGGLFRSADAGATWLPVEGQPHGMVPHRAKLAMDGSLYVAYSDEPGPNGIGDGAVWKLNMDSGAWTDVTPEKPGKGNTFGYGGVAIDPANPGTVMVSTLCRWTRGDTVFRSTDAGRTWISLKDRATLDADPAPYLKWGRPRAEFGHWIGDVEIDPCNPDGAWYVTGATLWSTEDLRAADNGRPTSWLPALGIEETAVIGLASPPEGAQVVSALGDIAGFRHDDLRRSPPGGMWTNPLLNSTDGLDFAWRKRELFVRIGRGFGGVGGAVSTDGAATWSPFRTLPSRREGGSIAMAADGAAIVWATPEGAFRSTDRGDTWAPSAGAPARGRVAADRADPLRFTILDLEDGAIYSSRDGGASFTRIGSGVPGRPLGIVAAFGQAGHVWIPSARGLFRSSDGGATFTRVPGLDSAEAVSFGKAAPGADYPTVYAIAVVGKVPGVYRSIDAGSHWVRINDERSGFGTMQVIEGDPKRFGRVYLGTNGRGIVVGDPGQA